MRVVMRATCLLLTADLFELLLAQHGGCPSLYICEGGAIAVELVVHLLARGVAVICRYLAAASGTVGACVCS